MSEVTTWGAGEYRLMAERLAPAAEAAVRAGDVTADDCVLDVATGTGNAALVASALGAEVIAVDFEPALLAIAESRATSPDARVRWMQADAEALPVPDAWATVVVSVFGVMYAADQNRAAHELARCVAADGRIVLTAWVPGSFMPAMGHALGEFLPPPPPGSAPPSRWGDPAALDELFGSTGLSVRTHSVERLTMLFASDGAATDFLVRTAGNVMAEREHLAQQGRWAALQGAVRHLVQSRSTPADGRLRIDFDYLLASISRPGNAQEAS